MIPLFKKTFLYVGIFSVFLLSLDSYVLLKTFVIPSAIASVEENTASQNAGELPESSDSSLDTSSGDESTKQATITTTSYEDDNIQITLDTLREYDTNIYVANITLSSSEYLKTASAQDTFGTNITEKTSSLAAEKNAILAINGDYYGANSRGYVIKNGTLYRDSVRDNADYGDLVIYEDGTFGIINENEVSAQQLIEDGVTNLFAFGPTLIQNDTIAVSEQDEVKRAMSSNPRTVIGMIDDLHYIILVSDGRSSESEGLSLYEAAEIMASYGCETAYNLDGGGSSTLYFNGTIINNPTTDGRRFSERAVSDIVYIGY